jgi:hypothetical protein
LDSNEGEFRIEGCGYSGGPNCALCWSFVETENHLILLCPSAWSTWVGAYWWFEVVEVISKDIWIFFENFFSSIN